MPGFTECSRKPFTQQLPRLVQTGNLVLLQLPISANCIATAVIPEPQHGLGMKGEDTSDPYRDELLTRPSAYPLVMSTVIRGRAGQYPESYNLLGPTLMTPLGAITEEEEVRRTSALETCREDRQQCTQVNQSRRRLGLC